MTERAGQAVSHSFSSYTDVCMRIQQTNKSLPHQPKHTLKQKMNKNHTKLLLRHKTIFCTYTNPNNAFKLKVFHYLPIIELRLTILEGFHQGALITPLHHLIDPFVSFSNISCFLFHIYVTLSEGKVIPICLTQCVTLGLLVFFQNIAINLLVCRRHIYHYKLTFGISVVFWV